LVAGANAAGATVEFRGLPPSHRLKVLEQDLFSIGQFEPLDGSYCVYEREQQDSYLRLTIRDGAVVGANLLGDTSLASGLMTWVEDGTQIAEIPGLLEQHPGIADVCPNVK
jgi:NAD(P)H-nitrite reductase large subunit